MHIAVDTRGLPQVIHITTAKVSDRDDRYWHD
jgi:hypothetical protein